jgi:hypothetical protein
MLNKLCFFSCIQLHEPVAGKIWIIYYFQPFELVKTLIVSKSFSTKKIKTFFYLLFCFQHAMLTLILTAMEFKKPHFEKRK